MKYRSFFTAGVVWKLTGVVFEAMDGASEGWFHEYRPLYDDTRRVAVNGDMKSMVQQSASEVILGRKKT